MAVAANLCGYVQRRTAFQPYDFVFGVAIGASRRLAVTGLDSFTMHAFLNIFCRLVVASAASLRKARKMQGRNRRGWWQNRVPVVAVAANRGIFAAVSQGQTMDTGPIAFGLASMTLGTIRCQGGQI